MLAHLFRQALKKGFTVEVTFFLEPFDLQGLTVSHSGERKDLNLEKALCLT
jgi:hypothetical protein